MNKMGLFFCVGAAVRQRTPQGRWAQARAADLRYAFVAYQLAFLMPGMRPCDAISRNWMRLSPNWRM